MKSSEMFIWWLHAGSFRCGQEGGKEYLFSANHLPGKMSAINAGRMVSWLDVDDSLGCEGQYIPKGKQNRPSVTQVGGDAETWIAVCPTPQCRLILLHNEKKMDAIAIQKKI